MNERDVTPVEVPGKPGRRKRITTEVQRARRRLAGKLIAYTLVAIPAAYGTVRSHYQAERETVAAVNREKSTEIVKLQEWVTANKRDVDLLRAEIAVLRAEVKDDRRELTKLIVEIARQSGRTFRGVRHPEEPAPAPPRLSAPAAQVQRKIDALAMDRPEVPRMKAAAKRPRLKAPSKSLDDL